MASLSASDPGVEAELPRTREAVGGHDRAGDLLGPIHAIGVACDGEDSRPAVEFDRQRQQEFDVPPSPARSPDRHRRFSAGDEDAGSGSRLAVDGDLARDSGHHFPDFLRLALERVAEDERAIAGPGSPPPPRPSSEACGAAMMRVSLRAKAGSPGLGVSDLLSSRSACTEGGGTMP